MNFPDTVWREHVNMAYAGGDYSLTQTEAEAVAVISVPSMGIADLTGIEYFTDMTNLECYSNSLTELDLSGSPDLSPSDKPTLLFAAKGLAAAGDTVSFGIFSLVRLMAVAAVTFLRIRKRALRS